MHPIRPCLPSGRCKLRPGVGRFIWDACKLLIEKLPRVYIREGRRQFIEQAQTTPATRSTRLKKMRMRIQSLRLT